MSSIPPLPANEIPYADALPPSRPTVVTVVAIIGICLSGLGLLGGVCQIFNLFVHFGGPNPVVDAMKKNALLWNYTIVGTVIGWLLAGGMLAGCIGALNMTGWARRLMVYMAALQIVLGLVGLMMNAIYLREMMAPMLESSDPAARFGAKIGMVAGFVGTIIGMIFPVVVVILMTRASVRRAFGELGPAPM